MLQEPSVAEQYEAIPTRLAAMEDKLDHIMEVCDRMEESVKRFDALVEAVAQSPLAGMMGGIPQ